MTVKIKYEAKAILLCYNEVHYKGENSNIYFTRNNNPELSFINSFMSQLIIDCLVNIDKL